MTLKTASSGWAQTPERSNMGMLRVMTWLSLRLGRRAARNLLHLIAAYFLLFSPASRRASSQYLRRAFGRPARWRDLYRHFFTFAATIHDRVYLVNQRFELFDFEVHGEDTLLQLLADGRGLFLMGAHLGSFEVIHALGRKDTNLRVAMLMHEKNAKKINTMLSAINPDAAQDIIGLGHLDSMLKVQAHLDRGEVVGMLVDRTPGDDTLQAVQILGGNRYAIHFDALADFSEVSREGREAAMQAAITRYAELLDQYCRKAPYNWFNFFDFWQATPPKS